MIIICGKKDKYKLLQSLISLVEINKNQYTCHTGYGGLLAQRSPSSTHSHPHSFLERRRARPARECRMWELFGHCDIITNWLWHHQQHVNWLMWEDYHFLNVIYGFVCHVRNKIMYALLWWTVYAPTWVLFWCLLSSLLCNWGNIHQNNSLMST